MQTGETNFVAMAGFAIFIGLSLVITVAAIWVLFSIGARVYAGAVLQIGGRIKLRDAWRSAGE